MSSRTTRQAPQFIKPLELCLSGEGERDRPKPILGQRRTPCCRKRELKDASLDLRVKFQQVEEVRHADPADAQFTRERGLAQARSAIKPAPTLQGPS